MLVSLQNNTRLNVWPESINLINKNADCLENIKQIYCKTINLDKGDIIIFRADLVHSGASYEEENNRIHCYLDSNTVHRNPNKTFRIHKHACKELSNIIMRLPKRARTVRV